MQKSVSFFIFLFHFIINAYRYCERVLDIEPENALAYACKLCVEFRFSKLSDIAVYKGSMNMLTASKNYLKILQYGDDKLRAEVEAHRYNQFRWHPCGYASGSDYS